MAASLRNSIQKQMILRALGRLDHPTAQDILEEIRKEYAGISMGTVYRNLNVLIGNRVIARLCCGGSPDRFDWEINPHMHMRCNACKRYYNLAESVLPDMDARVERETGFTVQRHCVLFEGICPSCKLGSREK